MEFVCSPAGELSASNNIIWLHWHTRFGSIKQCNRVYGLQYAQWTFHLSLRLNVDCGWWNNRQSKENSIWCSRKHIRYLHYTNLFQFQNIYRSGNIDSLQAISLHLHCYGYSHDYGYGCSSVECVSFVLFFLILGCFIENHHKHQFHCLATRIS